MKHALLAVIWLAPMFAQEAVKPPEPVKATISNLDKEPPPYIPDEKDLKTAAIRAIDARHAAETRTALQIAEQASKVNFYNSAAYLNTVLANRLRYR